MSFFLQCADRFAPIWQVICRGDFCSAKRLKARARAHRVKSRLPRVNEALIVGDARIGSREVEPSEKALAKVGVKKLSDASTNEAREVLWTGILGAAKHLGKRDWRPTKPQSAIVQLRKGADGAPVYFIGMGVVELHLAQLICSERSIFAIEIPWPSVWRDAAGKNDVDALPTMDKLAAPYVAALSVHAGSSPCVLVGHSFNGLMAFHAAHQLNEQGGKVALVMLLDTETKDPAPYQVAWQQLQKDWGRARDLRLTDGTLRSISSRLGSSWSVIRWMLLKEMKEFGHRILRDRGVLTMKLDDQGIPWHWKLTMRVYSNVVKSYRLRCLDCRGVLFRSEEDGSPARTLEDDSLGWNNLFKRGLEIVQVTGSHVTMVREPHDRILARAMSEVLDRRENIITRE